MAYIPIECGEMYSWPTVVAAVVIVAVLIGAIVWCLI